MNWTGWYVGLNAALTQHKASETDVNGWGAGGLPPASYVMPFFSSRTTQLGIGGQAGYNWQYGNFVLGGEADINWVGAKSTFSPVGPGFPFCGPCAVSATNELNWMATFRARAGFSFNNVWIFGTAGLALAQIDDHWGYGFTRPIGSATPFSDSQFKLDEVRSGFVYGGVIEAPITRNWTGRAEVMYVNFGSQSSTISGTPAFGVPGTFTTSFHNSLTLGRLALSYRW
jgi:outer membrane immunogenic protein